MRAIVLALALSSSCWLQQDQWQQESEASELTRRRGESEAAALYRAGVNCQDVLERDACAIEYFERLVALNPRERALVGDAMFRLSELYRRDGREEQAVLLLRKFWDLGADAGRGRTVLSYGTRWLPADVQTLYGIDMEAFSSSRLSTKLSVDTLDMIFTCDEARRAELEEARDARRAERRRQRMEARIAAGEPEPTKSAGEKRRDARREERRREYDRESPPVYDEGACALARALDQPDPRSWRASVNARNALDPERSLSFVVVPELDARITEAVAAGRLERVGAGDGDASGTRWSIAGHEYLGGPVHLAKLDREELVLGSPTLIDEVLGAAAAREATINPAVTALARAIPRDVTFYMLASRAAVNQGLADMGALASLLPSPDGVLFGVVTFDYAGLFVRIPTSDPLKSAVLLSLARSLMEADADGVGADDEVDPGELAMQNMDLSQAPDGAALQMTTVLTADQIDTIFNW